MHWIHPARNPMNRWFTILFLVVAIQRQVRAFSLEGRSSKPLHSNDHDEESNSSSQGPQSSIFEKDLKRSLRTRQTNGSTWVRARLLGHNPNLVSSTPLYFKNFTIAIVWNARDVSNGPTRRRLDDLARIGL
ncbi:hypothetical protein FCV25MIE_28923 [Fagus crenata]